MDFFFMLRNVSQRRERGEKFDRGFLPLERKQFIGFWKVSSQFRFKFVERTLSRFFRMSRRSRSVRSAVRPSLGVGHGWVVPCAPIHAKIAASLASCLLGTPSTNTAS